MTYRPDQHPFIPGSWAIRNDKEEWVEWVLEDGKREPIRFDSAAEARQYMVANGLYDD